jgi:hypothetical protein
MRLMRCQSKFQRWTAESTDGNAIKLAKRGKHAKLDIAEFVSNCENLKMSSYNDG